MVTDRWLIGAFIPMTALVLSIIFMDPYPWVIAHLGNSLLAAYCLPIGIYYVLLTIAFIATHRPQKGSKV